MIELIALVELLVILFLLLVIDRQRERLRRVKDAQGLVKEIDRLIKRRATKHDK